MTALLRATQVLLTLLAAFTASADPLHKVGNEGAWQHEQSGWLFSQRVGQFKRVGAPWEIDGTTDVGAEYVSGSGSLTISIYATDSAAPSALLSGATQALGADHAPLTLQSESAFSLETRPALAGQKLTFAEQPGAAHGATLYYFSNPDWIVQIRTAPMHSDDTAAVDEFVRGLPWATLGTDPGELDAS